MIDIRIIRENADLVRRNCIRRGYPIDIDGLVKLDADCRMLNSEIETLRSDRNRLSKECAKDPAARDRVKQIKLALGEKENKLEVLQERIRQVLIRMPNLLAPDVPEGTDEATRRQVLAFYEPYYDSHCQIKTAPYPGIMELLHCLKNRGIQLAVISNKQEAAVKALAARHFWDLLALAVGTSDSIPCKPNPAAVLSAMGELGVEKSETLYVGDMDVDLNTARNAGIACACVSWGFLGRKKLESLGAEHIVDSTEELLAFILK